MAQESSEAQREERNARNVQTVYLDTYDDLFSDFDYGPYESRRMSEDLILELEGRLKHLAPGPVDLVFGIADSARERTVETMAKKRLKRFFSQKTFYAQNEIDKIRRSGAHRVTLGLGVLGLVSIILFYINDTPHPLLAGPAVAIVTLFAELLTPAGWFGMWTGFERFFDHPKAEMRKKSLYAMLEAGSISFIEESKLSAPSAAAQQAPAPAASPGPLRAQETAVPREVGTKP